MSAEAVRKLLGSLQEDPENEAVWTQLEEQAVAGELGPLGPQARNWVQELRRTYVDSGEAEAAARLLDIEAMMVNGNEAQRVAIVRERARILEEELLDDKSALAALESIRASDPDAGEAHARIAGKKDKWKELVKALTEHARETPDPPAMASHLASAASVVLQYKGKGRDKDVDTLFGEALTVDPGNLRAIQLYERVLRKRDKWDDLASHLERAADAVSEPGAKLPLLFRAARVHGGKRKDLEAAERIYRQVLRVDPSNRDANRFLVVLLNEQNRIDELVRLYEDQLRLPGNEQDVGLLMQIAMTHWRMRNDPGAAGPYFARIAAQEPTHPLPGAFFAEHPAHAPAATTGTATSTAASAEGEGEDFVEMSGEEEEMVVEVDAIDGDDANNANIDANDVPAEAQAVPAPVAAVASAEAVAASAPLAVPAAPSASVGTAPDVGARTSVRPAAPSVRPTANTRLIMAIDLAQQAEESGQVDRAIEAWKGVLRLDGGSREARDALTRLYAAANRWNNLVELLRQELESLGGAKVSPEGAPHVERKLEILREMVRIYRDKMALEPMVVQTYNAILTLAPGDLDALVNLGASFEKLGRHTDLIKVLEQQAEYTEEPAKKIEILRRVARIWIDRFNNVNNATKPLETILTIDPRNAEAIAELKDLYVKRRAWRPLFEVSRKEAELLSGTAKRDALVELAKLAAEKLNAPGEAIAVWREALTLDARTPGALDALEKLTERERDYAGLAEVLEQRAADATDVETRINVLMKLGTVYSERLTDPRGSIDAWRRVLEARPGHPKALRVLREAYTTAGDWDALEALYVEANDYEGLVEVLGSAADRADDPQTRIALSFRAAHTFETALDAPARAFRNYERVLAVDPKNLRAATALVPIYLADEKWGRLSQMYEILLGAVPAGETDQALEYLEKLRDLAAVRLADRVAAFRWALAAYKLRPTDHHLESGLEKAAADSGAWRELVATFDAQAIASDSAADRARLRDKAATIEADRLNAIDAAIARYQTAVAETPEDDDVVATLDRLLRRADRWQDLRDLFNIRLRSATTPADRRALLLEVASIEEERLRDADAAAKRYRAILADDARDADGLAALSRLAEAGNRWDELATLIAQRRDEAHGAVRAELAFKLGELQAGRLNDFDGAIVSFREVLGLVPHHPAALAALEALLRHERYRVVAATILEPEFAAIGEARKLAWVLQILLDAATDAAERRGLTLRLSRVYSEQLADPRSGFDLVRRILTEQPDQAELADELEGLSSRGGWHEELAEALAQVVAREDLTPDVRVDLARRAASIYDDALRRPEAAEPFHRMVLDSGGNDQHPFHQLKAFYQERERWDDLRALYAAWVDRADTPAAKIDLLGEEALVVEEILEQRDEAIEVYRKILALDETNATALRSLDRLFVHQQRWADLAALFTRWLPLADDDQRTLRFRRAEVYERQLNEFAKALDDYEAVVTEEPGHKGARAGLERLVAGQPALRRRAAEILESHYEADGGASAADLVRMLLVRLEATEAATDRAELYRRIADLRETVLGDAHGAFSAMVEAVLAEPTSEVLRAELLRLAEMADQNESAAEALERAAKDDRARDSQVAILRDLATLYDARIDDLRRAEGTYRRLLAIAPDDADVVLPAALALERIYQGLSEPQGLVEALKLRAKFESDATVRRELYARAGELQEFELRLPVAAIESQRARLDLEPTDRAAQQALARLYEATGQWPALVSALRADAQLASSGDEQKQLQLRAARVLEERVADLEGAIGLYTDVLDSFGPDRAVHAALARLYELSDRWPDLLDVLERDLKVADAPADRLQLIVRLAELRRVRTRDLPLAVVGYEEALALDPGQPTARAALETLLGEKEPGVALAAARALAPVLEAEQAWQQLVGVLDRIAAETDDADERRRALARAADVCEVGLNAPARAFRYAARELKDALSEADLRARIEHLEHLATAAGLHGEFASTLREVAPDLVDPDLQIDAYMKVAALARGPLGDATTARAYYEKALEQRSDYRPALDALESLHESAAAYPDLIDVLKLKIDLAVADADRRELLRKQARISEEHLGDRQAAARAYEAILGIGEDLPAAHALERIYAAEGRWDDLAQLLESQLASPTADPVDLHYRLGVVAATRLDNPDRAIEHFEQVLQSDHSHQPTVTALEELWQREGYAARAAKMLEPIYDERMDWQKVIHAREARIAAEEDVSARKELLGRLGKLYEENLEDLDRALDTYARVFREDISDRESWDVVARLAKLLGRYDKQAQIYADALAATSSDDDTTAEIAFQTAQLYDHHVGDTQKARTFYRRTLAFDPSRAEVFAALEALLTREASHEELLALYTEAAQNAGDAEHQKGFYFKIAEIQERATRDLPAAIATYRQVLDVDPTDRRAVQRLDELLSRTERWEELAQLLDTLVTDAVDSHERATLRFRLGRLRADRLGDPAGAVDAFEAIVEERRDHREAILALERLAQDHVELRTRIVDILEPLYRELDDWARLIDVLNVRLDAAHDPMERGTILREIAQLKEQRAKDITGAFGAYGSAFIADPGDGEARAEVERLAAEHALWDDLVRTYESALVSSNDNIIKADLLKAIAETHDTRRDDPRAAIEAYERLYALDDGQLEALDLLQNLHVLLSDWEGLVRVLERKVERSLDDDQRRALLHEIGEYQRDMLGNADAAIVAFRRALDIDPADAVALAALDDLYSASSNARALADVLQQRLDIEADPEERKPLALRLGKLWERALNDTSQAIQAYRRALDDAPTDSEALLALDRLYEATAAHHDLLENLRTQAGLASTEPARNVLRLRIGRLLAGEIADPTGALETYGEVLSTDASNSEAIAAVRTLAQRDEQRVDAVAILEPIFRQAGRWDELVQVLELKIASIDDPMTKRDELRGLAQVHRDDRRDAASAFETLRRALHEDPAHAETLADLESLAASLERWSDLASVLEDESSMTNDGEVARDLAVRAAQIAEVRLKDDTRATGSYRHALAQGDEESILESLDRIYTRGEKWRDVVEMLERRAAIATDPTVLDALDVRIAELRGTRFEDPAGALSSYRNVLERTPSHEAALRGLEQLLDIAATKADALDLLEQTYTSIDDPSKLAWIVSLRVQSADLASDKVRLLQDLSRLREERLSDPQGAFGALVDAFKLDPRDDQVVSEIERLAPAANAWGQLRGVVESVLVAHRDDLDSIMMAQLNLRGARWYREQLGDDRAAEERLVAALSVDPENADALELLEAIYRTGGRERDLVSTLKRRADIEIDTTLKKQMLREAAQIAEGRLTDIDLAAQMVASHLDTDDSDLEALESLARLRGLQNRHADVAELVSRRARLVDDPTLAGTLRRQVAELYAGPINDLDKAVQAYRELLDFDTGDREAREAIEGIFERTGRHRELEEALRSRIETAVSAEERNETRMRLAKLAEHKFANASDAIEYLREVVEETPTHAQAGTELERLYTSGRRWNELSELLERRAQDYADAGDLPGELTALVRIGELNERELHNVPRAIELYERVLDRDGNHVGALNALARLHEGDKQWDRAAEMLSRASELARPGKEGADVSLHLASLRAEKLNDEAGAEQALRRALELEPSSQQAIDRLKALATKRNDARMLAEILEREVTVVPESARKVTLYKTLAEIARDKLTDPDRAAGYLEKARDLSPEDRDLLLPLVDMYIAANRQRDAVPVIEKIIASYGTKRSKDLATWHHRLGRSLEALGDTTGALAQYDAAFKIDLTNVQILRDLGLLCYRTGEYDRAQKTFRALLLQRLDANSGITKADVYFYLGDTLRQQNDVPKAINMLERAVEAEKGHPRATALLAEIKR